MHWNTYHHPRRPRSHRATIGFLACLAAGLVASGTARAEDVLYRVTFASPPHTVGKPPAFNDERHPGMPTAAPAFNHARALVEAALGPLTDQPLVFRSGGQVEFDLSGVADRYQRYRVNFDFYADSMADTMVNNHFSVILDIPEVRNLVFTGNNRAYIFVPGKPPVFGTYHTGQRHHVQLMLDEAAGQLHVQIDDAAWPVVDVGAARLRSIRFALRSGAHSVVAVDNITIRGSNR